MLLCGVRVGADEVSSSQVPLVPCVPCMWNKQRRMLTLWPEPTIPEEAPQLGQGGRRGQVRELVPGEHFRG